MYAIKTNNQKKTQLFRWINTNTRQPIFYFWFAVQKDFEAYRNSIFKRRSDIPDYRFDLKPTALHTDVNATMIHSKCAKFPSLRSHLQGNLSCMWPLWFCSVKKMFYTKLKCHPLIWSALRQRKTTRNLSFTVSLISCYSCTFYWLYLFIYTEAFGLEFKLLICYIYN